MLTIQVCVGSSCFLRGSKNVIAEIQKLMDEFQLDDRVLLKGSFCHEKCTDGVTVMVGEKLFTGVRPKDVEDLFIKEILPVMKGDPECL